MLSLDPTIYISWLSNLREGILALTRYSFRDLSSRWATIGGFGKTYKRPRKKSVAVATCTLSSIKHHPSSPPPGGLFNFRLHQQGAYLRLSGLIEKGGWRAYVKSFKIAPLSFKILFKTQSLSSKEQETVLFVWASIRLKRNKVGRMKWSSHEGIEGTGHLWNPLGKRHNILIEQTRLINTGQRQSSPAIKGAKWKVEIKQVTLLITVWRLFPHVLKPYNFTCLVTAKLLIAKSDVPKGEGIRRGTRLIRAFTIDLLSKRCFLFV